MRICSGAGCLRVVADDVRWCDECKPQSSTDTDDIRVHTLSDRIKYAFLYSSARWTRLRGSVARAQPFCARCHNRITVIVDHAVPAGVAIVQVQQSGKYGVDKWAGFFMRSNLQGLCRECHYIKTEEDKAHVGVWPDVLEKDALTTKHVFTF